MALISVSNNALSGITALPASIPTGALTLLSTQTASASATISFTTGLDSTYSSYIFKFINIHASNDGTNFLFQGSVDGGSNYNIAVTNTAFEAYHAEDDGAYGLAYNATRDSAQGTAFLHLNCGGLDADNDSCLGGSLQIFNPSSTTFVKHYLVNTNNVLNGYESDNSFMAGYFNNTNAIDAVQFKMSAGNIDDGIIKLYGVS